MNDNTTNDINELVSHDHPEIRWSIWKNNETGWYEINVDDDSQYMEQRTLIVRFCPICGEDLTAQ